MAMGLSTFVVLLLLSAALKDDQIDASSNIAWASLSVPPLLQSIKSHSYLLLLTSFLLPAINIARTQTPKFKFPVGATLILTLTILAALRSTVFDPSLGAKMWASVALYAGTFLSLGYFQHRLGFQDFLERTWKGVLTFCFILIYLNLACLASGYGFALGNPRFFGTTTHPNFLGVQLAICNIALLFAILRAPKAGPSLLFCLATLIIGLYLQYLTGSRTSFLILAVGCAVTSVRSRGPMFTIRFAALGALTLGIAFALGTPSFSEESAFHRGDVGPDTRTAAWIDMLDTAVEHPIFGYGNLSGHSENSFLRAMSAFGIPYGVLFILSYLFIGLLLYKASKMSTAPSNVSHVFFGVFSSLLLGAFLEGYLIDSWSLPKAILLILAFSTSRSDPTFTEDAVPSKRQPTARSATPT